MEIKIKPRTKIIEPQHLLNTRGVGQQGFDCKKGISVCTDFTLFHQPRLSQNLLSVPTLCSLSLALQSFLNFDALEVALW